ncbi:MAG: secondary thiamine-phosphate synthase enzyme YjbQ [Aquificaceae bacterium]|nr:secondary thiamine-phosphate synthase enzyme YjbQ [Aquificaceae bacterium]MDW8237136.1 secondary thiamine-phosphate synthase enzyme YjbQ [Aquificaceae bacterium]
MPSLSFKTTKKTSFVNITQHIKEIVKNSGVSSGLCLIYVPHTTACVIINEGVDPTVVKDISQAIEGLIPWSGLYEHPEGNSAAHIRSAIIGNSRIVPLENGELMLGSWEGIFLVDFDGPRERKVIVKILKEV